jgi:glycosyltransferase involved in cell wall biosynthesis
VKLLGFVPDQDLAVLYRQALAFVSASLEEGFGIAPVEALAAGGSVVLARIPTFKEICGDLAYYFDSRDPATLARTLLELYYGKAAKRGQLKPDRYTWKKMAQEIKKIYEEVVS